MKTVILAGGLGTRISEESHLRPKPMIEIGDNPILWHIMKYYSSFGYNDFIICCGYRGYMIKEYFADYYLHRSDVTFNFSESGKMTIHTNISEPWKVTLVDTGLETQTGGRIRRIARYTDDKPFMLTYGDGVGNIDINALLETHKNSGNTVTITAVQPSARYGVLELDDSKNRVVGFREKAKEDTQWINAGFMVVQPEVFKYIDSDSTVFESDSLEKIAGEKKLGIYKHYDYWQCMDTQRDKYALENKWSKGNAPWKVWE